jgi:hypothetical protein
MGNTTDRAGNPDRRVTGTVAAKAWVTRVDLNVLLFGATGMVGDGVLYECAADARVRSVLAVTRSPLASTDAKVR